MCVSGASTEEKHKSLPSSAQVGVILYSVSTLYEATPRTYTMHVLS
jgi:hypothetical protein